MSTAPPPTTPPKAPSHKPVNKWVIAGTVILGTFMSVLDTSIVNVALPQMTGTLGVNTQQITWVVTSFVLATVIVMPITALLSKQFGRRNFYLFSVALFTVGSMLSGLARTLPVMIAFRIVQGIGGGTLQTVSQAILRESFPVKQQGIAMGLFGMGVVLAPAVGPTLGGYLTDRFSWPLIFYINVPIGIINIFLVSRFIFDPPYLERGKGNIDWLGLALMMVGLGAMQIMLEEGQQDLWFQSTFIIISAAVSVVALSFFVWRELRIANPAVELRILKNGSFSAATFLNGILGMGLLGTLFLLPIFLQNIIGYSPFEAGIILIPRSLAMIVFMPISGQLYNLVGTRTIVGVGLAICAYSFWTLARLTTQVGFDQLFWPQVWQGVGFSLVFVTLSTAALATIPRPMMTAATGLYNVIRQIFSSVGVAVAATLVTDGTTTYAGVLGANLTEFSLPTRLFLQAATRLMLRTGVDSTAASERALALLNLTLTNEASALAYNHVFKIVAILFAASIPLIFLLRRPAKASGAAEVTAG